MLNINNNAARTGQPAEAVLQNTSLYEILEAFRQDNQLFPEDSLIPLTLALLQGLADMHAEGRIAGPITPKEILLAENRFILQQPEVTIVDLADPEELKYRISHFAPEMLSQGVWNQASDLFCGGNILWQALAGQHPFRYEQTEQLQLTVEHLVDDPPLLPPGLYERASDRGLLTLACAMLEKNPAYRFTARQLLQTIHTGQGNSCNRSDASQLPLSEDQTSAPGTASI